MTGCGQGKTAGQTVSVLDVGQTDVVSILDVGDPEAVPGEGELASEPGVVDHQPLDDRVGQHQLVHLGGEEVQPGSSGGDPPAPGTSCSAS